MNLIFDSPHKLEEIYNEQEASKQGGTNDFEDHSKNIYITFRRLHKND